MAIPVADIEQTLRQSFQRNFYLKVSQKKSLLANTAAVTRFNFSSARHNLASVDGTELVKSVGRNPLKEYIDYTADSRMISKSRFSRYYRMDKKDVREMISNPNSRIYEILNRAFNKMQDRLIVAACTEDVLTGNSDTVGQLTSAAEDGVMTIDATATGITYEVLTAANANFINNEVTNLTLENVNNSLIITGNENLTLQREDKYINNQYLVANTTTQGAVNSILGTKIYPFAGSVNAGITVPDPVLPEGAGTRDCLFLAEGAIMLAISNVQFEYNPNLENYIDTCSIGLKMEACALRMEGKKIQIIKTTI